MVIGDVGQSAREEVDFAPSPLPGVVGGAGANYGWNCREGLHRRPGHRPRLRDPPPSALRRPVFDYPHDPDPDLGGADRCSIIGGYVVRDPGLGALYGRYLYADYCGGALRSLQLPASADGRASDDCSLGLQLDNPVSFGEDAAAAALRGRAGRPRLRLAGLPPAGCPPPPPPAPRPHRKPASRSRAHLRRHQGAAAAGRTRQAALLTVWVSPCDGRRGQSVELLRNGHANGIQLPQPRLHRPLPAEDQERHQLRRHRPRRRSPPAGRVAPAEDQARPAPPRR